MEEMLTRRFRRWAASGENALQPGHKPDPSFSVLPDLVIVDGGKGQLGRVTRVLETAGLKTVLPVVGLAKQREEIFFPGKPDPLMLPRHSPALYLLQRIRDEAHRYGITAHRKKRTALGLASQLDSLPGIGPARRKALLKHFGSMDAIRQATIEQLKDSRSGKRSAVHQDQSSMSSGPRSSRSGSLRKALTACHADNHPRPALGALPRRSWSSSFSRS